MNKKVNIWLGLILTMVISACGSAKILKPQELALNQVYVYLENDLARVGLPCNRLLDMETMSSQEECYEASSITLPLSLSEKDRATQLTASDMEFFLTLEEALIALLKSGDVVIVDKRSDQVINRYHYELIEDKLGTQTEVFSFSDKTEFFYLLKAIGE